MKSTVLATGYGQDLLDQPVVETIAPERRHVHRLHARSSSADKAIKQFQADLKKYAGFTGVPDFGSTPATSPATWRSTGCEAAGQEPDP